ncbi:transketolase [Candidatus Shapirobacteria bacterium]|nr:MAG: transketolase [Candidatus Shapirobacteria bacterium]
MSLFSNPKIKKLQKLSKRLRKHILDINYYSQSSHLGGPLSSIDLINTVYFSDLFSFSDSQPSAKDDRFILSAGHLCPALYAVLSVKNYFSVSKLKTYSQFKSILQGHVSTDVPGVSYSSGSLGQGLSFATGLALADKIDHKKKFTICLTSDAEHQEGQIWEAVTFANKYNLNNLINIVDNNKYQIDGAVDDIMPLEDLGAKYIHFGWSVKEVNGHDFKQILRAFKQATQSIRPTAIIAHTTFAKGVSFMQHDYHYHDLKNLSSKLYQQTVKEISQGL